jgi:hypothetical protein
MSRIDEFSTIFQSGRLAILIDREQVQLMRRAEPTAASILDVAAVASPWLDPIPLAQCCHCASLPPNEVPYLLF